MQLKKTVGALSFIIISLLVSCKPATIEQVKPAENVQTETFVRVNKILLQKDKELIKEYITRHKYNMTETETGLWVDVYEQGKGKLGADAKVAKIKYKAELLDGTLCYTSDSLGLKEFVFGTGAAESGLEEGVLLMKQGAKARFILPPHLAYGLSGDNNKIPPRAIVVYHVELIELKEFKK